MENISIKTSNVVYVALDGDSIGAQVGRAVLADDPEELHRVSRRIDNSQDLITRWIRDVDGDKISGGGDECTMAISEGASKQLEGLRKDIEYAFGFTVSIGIGKSLSEAGKALLIAKLKGKDRIEKFSKYTEKEIKAIKKRAKKGVFRSMEEYKLAGAYLKKGETDGKDSIAFRKPEVPHGECEYCNQSDGIDPDHCKYCHGNGGDSTEMEEKCKYCGYDDPMATTRMDLPEMEEQDCEFCKEMDQAGKDDCKYCQESAKEDKTIAPNAMNPSADSHNESAPAGSMEEKEMYNRMGMNPPEIGKPDPSKEAPIGQNAPMDVVPVVEPKLADDRGPGGKSDPRLDGSLDQQNGPAVDPEDNHSKEALHAIAEQIEDEGTPPESKVDSIDDDPSVGASRSAEGNISRPEGFEQNIPQDMGIAGANPPSDDDQEPDFSDIFEEGLNSHASEIQKEKVVRTVSQALMQFKQCKGSLEAIKLQDPQLYQASISMLRAMIEMANLLELGGGMGAPMAQPALGQEQQELMPEKAQEEQNDEWHDPFPAHPDQGGEPKPGHAPSSAKEDDSPSPQP